MKSSPFPGMDPYLEDRWPEVHARLIVYAANQINSGLPNDLQANIEENLAVYADDHAGSRLRECLPLLVGHHVFRVHGVQARRVDGEKE